MVAAVAGGEADVDRDARCGYAGTVVRAKHFTVIIEPDAPRGYHAWVPDLPGCHSDGRTAVLAKRRIREAIDLYLETLESRATIPSH